MHRTAVIFLERATPNTLTEFKDALSNMLVNIAEPWSMDFKTYRSMVRNLPAEAPKVMYSVKLSHHELRTVLIQDKNALITTSKFFDIPSPLVASGCSTGTCETVDSILASKLSNIWSQRQGIRGESGETLDVSDLIIRVVNLFSATGFKGLLVELEAVADEITEEEFDIKVGRIKNILDQFNIKDTKISKEFLNPLKQNYLADLAYQYLRALEY